MSFIDKLSGVFSGGLVSSIGEVADRFIETDSDKKAFQLQLERLINERQVAVETSLQAELQAKERVIVAEMTQGDSYTKRARPTVVYAGLIAILFNYCLVPAAQSLNGVDISPFELPIEFWSAWGGCVGIWTIGRTMEKRGGNGPSTRLATGTKKTSLFD